MRKHESMLRKGKVSVWTGNFDSEDELLAYVDDGAFGSDFDFQVKTIFGRELRAEKRAVAIDELVQGCSSWRAFESAVVKSAKDAGIASAKCIVIFYAFEYVRSPGINRNAPLVFLGAFDFY